MNSYKYIYVKARNMDVIGKIIANYPQLQGHDGVPRVFCIANKDYEGNDFNNSAAHLEAIRGSGVPELRRFCRSIVSCAQFKACNHFLRYDIPNLLQSLQSWLNAYKHVPQPLLLTYTAECAHVVSNAAFFE